MTELMVYIFWASIGLILYAYVGFTLVLCVRGLWNRPVAKADITPMVSLVIVAHNEAATIAAKLDNALGSSYPRDKLEIIVASDGSDDGTDEIVARYADRGVQLLSFSRIGKIPALNEAVTRAAGDVLVLSDANSLFEADSLAALVRPFADPAVGGVAGNQCYSSGSGNAASFGERLYWSFDRLLKTLGSRSGNVIASTGSIHAIRRTLFRPVPLGVGDDFVISTRVILQGVRLVFEPRAVAREATAPSDRAEFQRKVRVIVRGLRGLWAVRGLFNPLRHGFYSVQIFSHKLLRWMVGWLLIVLLGSSIYLSQLSGLGDSAFVYRVALWCQVSLYGSAVAALVLRRTPLARLRLFRLFSIPFYFCLANVAALQAWLQLLRGKRVDVWNSTRQADAATANCAQAESNPLLASPTTS